MTINAVGAQGVVNASVSLAIATQALAEVTIFTTAATANYIAIVDLSLVAILLPPADSAGDSTKLVIALPGDGSGGPNSSGGNSTGIMTTAAAGTTLGGNGGLMLALANATPLRQLACFTSRVKVGPSTAVKFTYAYHNTNATAAGTFYYACSYHVCYVSNP